VFRTGVRLYFSLGYSYGYYAGASSSQLNLLHVRTPPNPSANSGNRPNAYAVQNNQVPQGQSYVLRDLRAALQARSGLFLAANEERVWFAAAHSPPRGLAPPQPSTQRAEIAMTIDLPGGTFAIAECPSKGDRREFIALNSSLAAVFAQQRPVDTLASLLEGQDGNELKAFASECVPGLPLAAVCSCHLPQQHAGAELRHVLGTRVRRRGGARHLIGGATVVPRLWQLAGSTWCV
jgi:hypothetical protein